LQNGSCNDVGCDQLGPCVEYQLMLNVVEIMLTKFYHVCMYVPRVRVKFYAPRPSVKTARWNLGDEIFRA
jgi:hypothetical protein